MALPHAETVDPAEIAALIPGGTIYLRPALGCVAGSPEADPSVTSTSSEALSAATTVVVEDPTAIQALPMLSGGLCQLGPSEGTASVFFDDATAELANGGWSVMVSLRDGADGTDV